LTVRASLSRRNKIGEFNICAFHTKGELFAIRGVRAVLVGRFAVMRGENPSSLHL